MANVGLMGDNEVCVTTDPGQSKVLCWTGDQCQQCAWQRQRDQIEVMFTQGEQEGGQDLQLPC